VIVGNPGEQFRRPGTRFEPGNQNVLFREVQRHLSDDGKSFRKGGDQAPLYQFLTDKSANPQVGGEIQWNFTKIRHRS